MKRKKSICVLLILTMMLSMLVPFTSVHASEALYEYDLKEYMKYYEGTAELKVYNGGTVVTPDANGNYCINEEGYHFELKIASYGGLEKGYYYYQLPLGVRVSGTAGNTQDIYIGNSNYIERTIYEDGTVELYVSTTITDSVNFTISEYIDITLPSIKDGVEVDWNNQQIDVKITASIPKQNKFLMQPKAAMGYYNTNIWHIENTHGINISSFDDGEFTDLSNVTVKLHYADQEITLKSLDQVTDDDEFAFLIIPDGVVLLFNRCNCNSYENCYEYDYSSGCQTSSDGWCQCWHLSETSIITIEYSFPEAQPYITDSNPWIEYKNFARIFNNQNYYFQSFDSEQLNITIEKDSNLDFYEENYMESYETVVNPTMFDFSGNSELVFEESLSNLAYVPGTIEIWYEDINGKGAMLELGADYTIEYIAGENGQNKLNITFKNPGKYTYYVYYYAQIVVLDTNESSVETQNTSTLKFLHNPTETINYTYNNSYNWWLEDYSLTIEKVDETDDTKKVQGAKYGLFAQDGVKMAEGVTDENGQIVFQSDLERNIVFTNGIEYYVQELEAPEEYYLDETKHYFKYRIIREQGSEENTDDISYTVFNNYSGKLTLTNKEVPQADLIINKADANDKKIMLLGGTFGLYRNRECTDLVSESTEVGNGVYSFGALRINQTYYLKDLKAPTGYSLDPNTYMVSFEDGEPVVTTLQSELYNEGDFTFYNAKLVDGENNESVTPGVGDNANQNSGSSNSTENSQSSGTPVENTNDKNSKLPYTGGESNKATYVTIGSIVVVFAILILKSQHNKKNKRTPRIGKK